MDKDRHTIAATELSKFDYCPYQWYYERLYGRNELRRLEKERNERLGLEDKRKERLEQGVRYHNDIYVFYGRRRRVIAFAVLIILSVIIVPSFTGAALLYN